MADGLRISSQNPRYFSFDGKPFFFTGATPTWTPISDSDCDFSAENKALIEHGGNFTRILVYFPAAGLLPWNSVNAQIAPNGGPVFDLDSFNGDFWKRLAAFCEDCAQKNIIIWLEIFDEPSIRYDKGPHARYAAHPFNPDNNINLTTDDGLPAGAYQPTCRQLYDAVRVPGMKRVLGSQQRYVEKVLETTAPYANRIVYSICNEYTYNEGSPDAADKSHAFAFPKYWADFIHDWARNNNSDLLVAMMPGRSPDTN